jgi:hypothetical protein
VAFACQIIVETGPQAIDEIRQIRLARKTFSGGKFVAAQPGDRFAFDAAGLQPMTDLDNRTIALGMAPSGR